MESDGYCLRCFDRGTHLVCIHPSFHQSGRSTIVPVTLGPPIFIFIDKTAHRRARHHGRRRSQDRLLCRPHRRRAYVHRDAVMLIFAQESLFFVTQALTTWQWSRLSDFIGRRPVILLGLLGLSVSNFAFGLSRTLVTLIIRSVKSTTYPNVD